MRKLTTGAAALLALVMLTGAAMAAAPTVNDGTLDSAVSTGSDISDESTITGFEANDTVASNLSYQADSNNSVVKIRQNDTGRVLTTISDPTQLNWNDTDNDGIFNASVEHDSLATLERGIDDNVTVEARIINDSSLDDPDTTNVTVYVESTDAYSVEYYGGDEDTVTSLAEEPFLGLVDSLASDYSELESDDRAVNGSATTVVLAWDNSTIVDDFDHATTDVTPLKFLGGEAESGDRIYPMSASVAGNAVPVYYDERPDDIGENETVAIYEENLAGSTALTVDLGEDYEDRSTVDVTGTTDVPWRSQITAWATDQTPDWVPMAG